MTESTAPDCNHIEPVGPPWRGDAIAAGVLLLLLAVVSLNRAVFDSWIVRHDIQTAYLPWYAFLGEQLRALHVPGWNPHQFSGTPFAGDPQSGWMYLPVMLAFTLFGPVTAFQATVALELAIGGFGAYALARVLRLRPLAATMTAVVFAFGPLLFQTTYCCTVRAQLTPWIPVALLGVELALRSDTWPPRVAAWFLAGFAMSQMYAGWLGQGSLDAGLVAAFFILYRAVISPPRAGRSFRGRLLDLILTGSVTAVLSVALGAAGLLPRLAVNTETNLANADYDKVGGYSVHAYSFKQLMGFLVQDDYRHGELTLAGATLVLALIAPFLARRRYAVPFFTGLTVVVFTLALPTTPLHQLFFLVPMWKELHEHNVPHVTAAGGIGPAMLAGAAVQCLPRRIGRRAWIPLLLVPAILIGTIDWWTATKTSPFSWTAISAVVVATFLVVLAVTRHGASSARMAVLVPALLIAVAFVQPAGLTLLDSWTGTSLLHGWSSTWHPPAAQTAAQKMAYDAADPGGAGEFLQQQQATEGPFRYLGYGGLGYPGDKARRALYTQRRFDPQVEALLLNARSIFLGINDIQGYNPVQLRRYVDLFTAINGSSQDYHQANIKPKGVDSTLLNLLDVRYLLLDASIPSDRSDVLALTAGRKEVFRDNRVVVYENEATLSPAWIVHSVTESGSSVDALTYITDPGFAPAQQAVVEGSIAEPGEADTGAAESAQVTTYEPDRIALRTSSTAPGLLVLSEIYSRGWVATIDGKQTPVLPTDYALRGIALPAGEHEVVFSYRPRSLEIGLWLTATSTLAMLIAFAFALRPHLRRRRSR